MIKECWKSRDVISGRLGKNRHRGDAKAVKTPEGEEGHPGPVTDTKAAEPLPLKGVILKLTRHYEKPACDLEW